MQLSTQGSGDAKTGIVEVQFSCKDDKIKVLR